MPKMKTLLFIGKSNSFIGRIILTKLKKKKIRVIFFDKKKISLKQYLKSINCKIDILWTNFGFFVNNQILKFINNSKLLIVSQTTGLNHINFSKKNYPKVKIISLKNDFKFLRTIPSTAEHTFALFLALSKNIVSSFQEVKKMNWKRNSFLSLEIKGLIFGIVGNGRIGRILGKIASSFGMKVLYYDLKKNKSRTKLNFLLEQSDVVSLNIDYKKINKNFFNKYHFDKMKNTSFFINTSRGENVNQKDLLDALKKKKIAGAGLDVLNEDTLWFESIPLKYRNVINYSKKNPNLIITPHIAGHTKQALSNTFDRVLAKMIELV